MDWNLKKTSTAKFLWAAQIWFGDTYPLNKQPMTCPKLKNIILTFWQIKKTSFWFGGMFLLPALHQNLRLLFQFFLLQIVKAKAKPGLEEINLLYHNVLYIWFCDWPYMSWSSLQYDVQYNISRNIWKKIQTNMTYDITGIDRYWLIFQLIVFWCKVWSGYWQTQDPEFAWRIHQLLRLLKHFSPKISFSS